MSKKYTTNFLEDTNGSTGSANQVLISTPSGIDWVDGSGSSIIGGPYLPLAGGTITGNLTVNGTINSGDQLTFPYGFMSDYIYHTGDSNTYFGFPANDTFIVATSGTEIIRINSSGNVGIGTTNPAIWKLSVDSNTIYAASFDTSNNVGVVINGNNTTASQIIGFSTSNSTYNELHLRTNSSSTDGLYIDGSGNVGIGETNPLTKLHIAGTTDANIIRIENTSTALSQGDTIGAIQFFNNDTTDDSPNIAASIYATAGPSGGSGSLRFKTTEPGTEGDPATDTMIITNGGYVGIGTDSPGAELEVSLSGNPRIRLTSTNNTTSTLQFADADDVNVGFIQYDHGVDAMEFRVNDVERMRITSTGGISFGSTGTAYGNSGQILKSNANASPTWVDASTVIGGPYLPLSAGLSYPLTGDLFIEGDSTPKITLTDTTNNLEGRIRVANNFMYIEADDSDTVASTVMLLKTDGVEALRLDGNQDATFAETIAVQGTGDSYFQGNVGIGTTIPDSKLDVTGGDITVNTSSTGFMNFKYGSVGSESTVGSIQTDGIDLKINATSDLLLLPGGNVGIGTTNPLSKLVVSDDGGAGIEVIPQTSNDRTTLLSYDRNTNTYQTLDFDGSDMHFNVFGSERMRIDSSGNVGIGVTTIGNKLEVAGTINQTVLGGAPSDDLNNLDSTRFFKTHTATTNAPAGISSFGMGWTIAYATNQTVQFLTSRASSQPVYYRKQSNGTYSSWIRLRDENQISDTDISNWDAAYTYSQVGHLPLTGGTMTGDINIGIYKIKQDTYDYLTFEDDTTTHNPDTNVTTLTSISGIALATNTNDGGGGNFTVSTGSTGTQLLRITTAGDATFTGDLIVTGGDITLSGTGRIQGIDTVTADTDAVNKLYVDTAVSGYIDGSGTAGYVAFWSDSNTITGESNLFWNASNNRLGIGTPSPGSSLEVSGLTQTDKLRYNYPLSDKVYSGEIADFGLVDTSVSAGDIVYLDAFGKWRPAQADSIANGAINMLGFYDGTDVILRGPIRFGSSGGSTPRIPAPTPTPTSGEPLYLSPASAGDIWTVTNVNNTGYSANQYTRIIGHIIDYANDVFYFNPDNTWVKNA